MPGRSISAPARASWAAKDAQGRALAFAADTALTVTDTAVAMLCSLRVARDPSISPEREFDYPTRIQVETPPLLPPEAAYAERAPWWPPLGGAVRDSAAQAHDARLGFAIASRCCGCARASARSASGCSCPHPASDDPALQRALRPRTRRAPSTGSPICSNATRRGAPAVPATSTRDTGPSARRPGRAGAGGLDALAGFRVRRATGVPARGLLWPAPTPSGSRNGWDGCSRPGSWPARKTCVPADLAALACARRQARSVTRGRRVEIDDPLILIHLAARRRAGRRAAGPRPDLRAGVRRCLGMPS